MQEADRRYAIDVTGMEATDTELKTAVLHSYAFCIYDLAYDHPPAPPRAWLCDETQIWLSHFHSHFKWLLGLSGSLGL